uniref:Secreted protein n=1 Tax=Panagrellus redivivus TaxID=6233 RepID=A0A7E4VAN9_PANRE
MLTRAVPYHPEAILIPSLLLAMAIVSTTRQRASHLASSASLEHCPSAGSPFIVPFTVGEVHRAPRRSFLHSASFSASLPASSVACIRRRSIRQCQRLTPFKLLLRFAALCLEPALCVPCGLSACVFGSLKDRSLIISDKSPA